MLVVCTISYYNGCLLGHLRLHHRNADDSVPAPGFEIPKTPGEITLLELEAMDAMENEARDVMEINDCSIINDNGSSRFHDSESTDSWMYSTDKRSSYDRQYSFCRCLSSVREVTFTSTTCKTCGKTYLGWDKYSDGTRSKYGGSTTFSQTYDNSSKKSSNRFFGLDGQSDRTKGDASEAYFDPTTERDFDGLQHLTGYEKPHVEHSSDGHKRNINPLVDPEIHRTAYMHALQIAQCNALSREGFVFDETKKLRRPNVFSYYSLLPCNSPYTIAPEYIGVRPDDSVTPKKGRYMKHIFGEVSPDDYYGEIVRSKQAGQVSKSAAKKPINIKRVDSNAAKPEHSSMNLSEKSSISLRMKTKENL